MPDWIRFSGPELLPEAPLERSTAAAFTETFQATGRREVGSRERRLNRCAVSRVSPSEADRLTGRSGPAC
jgi:hypothetical protein